jgi:hypothetical protein
MEQQQNKKKILLEARFPAPFQSLSRDKAARAWR